MRVSLISFSCLISYFADNMLCSTII
uniref:Uncharacterized protein n=1 Tax=Arundo donax TaxID=35708 RepID=A0A0A9CKI9_ARUDO